ncbi:MAG: DUF4082 domain-containing protein [Propionibacteriaceae bacterium]
MNEIACENTQVGNPSSEWQITGSGRATIQGFATDISVNRGSTIGFKVKTTASSYRLDIYRMGYYGGRGARKITTVNPTSYPTQPNSCLSNSTGLVDCGNWAQTASWAVPADAVSGIYFAKLVAGTAASHIMFIVRNDASTSDLFFQTSDTTWQAYNDYGGNSLYEGSPAGRAYKVSYNRPFDTNAETPEDFVWNAEYPTVRYLEQNGYDVSYTTGLDSDRRGDLIKNHKTFLSVGHDEYWSGGQRANVEAAREAKVNLAFLSGNEVFWKTRWENSIAPGSAANRTLVSYKETHANDKIDPAGAATWTGTWRDPRFSPPGDGGRPENELTGTLFMVTCCTADMKVGGVDGAMRFWRNTRVANLSASQTTTLGSGVLGYEWDESPDNGYRPAGLIHLSSTTANTNDYLQDYGTNYAPGTGTHHLTLYRAPSGALVFGAGTVQWGWGLDDNHAIRTTGTADLAVRQATANLLADMGAQPATRASDLVAATATTDTTPPTSAITAPASGATVPAGQPVTVSGTATDAGGGQVGGVEVSVDNGVSWHPATGRGSWSYTFAPAANGSLTIKSRASDDSGRLETPSAGRTITVGTGPQPPATCPCTIWPSTATPAVAADSDNGAIELGVKFRSSQPGNVTGIRFYKGTGNSGSHVGSLWAADGTRLASATFGSETATGWQQVNFATPVPVAANTTYVASYFAPNGHYATSDNYFSTPITNGPLTALQDGADGPNGVYRYGTSDIPNTPYLKSNYWVDVVFATGGADTSKPTVTAKAPTAGATGVATSTSISATFSEPVGAASVGFTVKNAADVSVAGTVSYDSASSRATFTPSAALAAGTAYSVTVTGASDSAGNVMDPVTWSFTTAAAPPADTTKPTVTAKTPAASATNVGVGTTVTATFSEAVQPDTATVTLVGPSGSVAGTSSYNTSSRTLTFTPSASLAAAASDSVTVSGTQDLAGNVMDPVTWSFTTAASSSACPCTIWPNTAVPALANDPDADAIEVGVKFRASQNGVITGLRFYKGAANTGTHVGTLWVNSSKAKLGSVTFSGESASGWQQASFAAPIAVTAGTTYVASYFAPNGKYAVNESYFSTATTRGPLTALQNGTDGVNGVYKYGATGFPSTSYKSSNYWVDVVFATS